MFKKILIANRGAIAVRIIRTLQKMNITSVAIYSEADKASLHVELADETIELPGNLASETYLDIEKILHLAKVNNVEAIHPGYGFLSENANFARRCAEENITFIGPTPGQLEQFGLKHTARDLAKASGVPLVPGSDLLTDIDNALATGESIGYPIMLKSTAGGGGIGMKICQNPTELKEAFDSVKRLSKNNFGNDGVFLEKYINRSRHIEVQVVGDGKGYVATLGERDCSLQRRNQKVVEETPAPNLAASVRDDMINAARKLAEAVNYQSAGTVEYIYDVDSKDFYFLEMNTRLQVEHGVTEMVTGVDLVEWMIKVAADDADELINYQHKPQGHAIQARVYAEDPYKNFQPSSGLLTHVALPENNCRCDSYIRSGLTISAFYDPMLAKIITHEGDRSSAIKQLVTTLTNTRIEGIVSNLHYLQKILEDKTVEDSLFTTNYLNTFNYHSVGIDVLKAGTQTTVQDYPGRISLWNVGIPPSGPMDNLAFQMANKLVDNDTDAAALEITLTGPSLQFRNAAIIALTGAPMSATLDGEAIDFWKAIKVNAGSILELGKLSYAGMRTYLAIKGGIQISDYLNSKSTFTLGQFGGHSGRALHEGDVLPTVYFTDEDINHPSQTLPKLQEEICPRYSSHWEISVIYGPHGAPDFFTEEDINTFFDTQWKVHFNSSRTGVRLNGPKPQWARKDGGEAGLHPSNIHDNAYAIGAVDFTGDMPVILGPDGPSLGGFVCPVTIVKADLWKLGQLKPEDTIQFIPVSMSEAEQQERDQQNFLENLLEQKATTFESASTKVRDNLSPILYQQEADGTLPKICYRISGDDNILIEYGELELDLRLRFRVHALMLWLENERKTNSLLEAIIDITPGIRSLQIHYDNLLLSRTTLLSLLIEAEEKLGDISSMKVPTRTVYLPLSWDDPSTQLAIDKYMTTVNPEAPWCPSNIEFIRRINGLNSVDEVKEIVLSAHYLVMGLGDVYLGAPVATPLDPRHRLVTTKYNPARTWTPENAVGIGGAYMCVYGMEGPGGYQFVGRTLQMWNRYNKTKEFSNPWLLRFFDQIRFYEVSAEELTKIRSDFPLGRFSLRIEESEFSLAEYESFLEKNSTSIENFRVQQRSAFSEERERWEAAGLDFDAVEVEQTDSLDDITLCEHEEAINSHIPGSLWKLNVKEDQTITAGDTLAIIESMKMEFPIIASKPGTVTSVLVKESQQLTAGQTLFIVRENN